MSAIELKAPLPDGDLEARLTWREKRSGPLPDRDADREGATHATLWTRGLGGRTSERTLTLDEADGYLDEARRLAERMDEFDRRSAERRTEAADERAATAAALDVSCPHCGVPRRYAGRLDILAAGAGEHVAREDAFQLARPQAHGFEHYVCPRCGSTELFAAGALDHPLPGSERS